MPSISADVRRRFLLFIKLAIFCLVTAGIGRSLWRARTELAEQPFNVNQLGWHWFALAAFAYALSMLPMAWFWQRLLINTGQNVGTYETFRAYTIGHLGKYVPGKVMVIVLRTGLIRNHNVDGVLAAVTVFIETLTMMATGAFLAAITLVIWSQDQRWLQCLALGLMLSTVFVTLPPVLKRVVRKLKANESSEDLDAMLANVGWASIATGWLASCVTWALITLSLWFTLQGIPNATPLPINLASFAQLLSSISLAVVAGFLSLIPGGLGVREWVLDQTMIPMLGAATAVVSAIVLRLIWLLAELVLSLILYFIPPTR